jgi:hypothetical protein
MNIKEVCSMNNPLVLKFISVTAFIISALFTILLMTSGTVGILAFILTVGMAVILEVAKCGFFYESLTNTKLLLPIRALLGVIALLLVASSIFASGSYVQNQANKTKNKQLKESSQFKQLEQGKALQQDLYNVKKKEIDDLKGLQEQQKQEGTNIINSMPKNYIDRRNQQRVDTQKQVTETQKLIDKKSDELSGLGAALQNPIDSSNVKVNSDNGYTAMFKSISEVINSSEDYKNDPVKPESLEMWFFIGLGIIFELVAVLTAYLAQLKGKSVGAATKRDISTDFPGIGFKPQVVTAISKDSDGVQGDYNEVVQAKRQIGFQSPGISSVTASTRANKNIEVIENLKNCESCNIEGKSHDTSLFLTDEVSGICESCKIDDIDNKVLNRYLDYIYSHVKNDGSIPGYQTTARDLGLGLDFVRKLKNHCEHLGILESDSVSRKTFIIKPRNEIKF